MKYLGIDYGTKKVGIAVSDEEGKLAFPREVIPNSANLLKKIAEIVKNEKIEAVVLGESRDFRGTPNPVMAEAKVFAKELSLETGVEVFFEPEFLTTRQAGNLEGSQEMIDARAAAIILQSFLDKKRSRKKE